MSRRAYVGIDLAIAKKKLLPVCFCVWDDHKLVPVPVKNSSARPPRGRGNLAACDDIEVAAYASEVKEYLTAFASQNDLVIKRIAIDAPSSPPREGVLRRSAEVAMDRAGISCFATPSARQFDEIKSKVARHISDGGAVSRLPHANQLWMLVGFELFRTLASVADCVEVFPQATVQMLGVAGQHKSRPGAVAAQLAGAARWTRWPEPQGGINDLRSAAFGPAHDCLDAYLSAWVAALPEERRTAHGERPDDVIWTPRISAGAKSCGRAPSLPA